jgi:asparagine synthase (glutamine-hydrolysing)
MRRALFASDIKERWQQLDAEAAIRKPYERSVGGVLERMLYADSKVRLPNHPVMITDRICMAHGLEARSPFMDHKLVEFAARLPANMKVRGGTLRYIQRRLAARYLPGHMLNRPKQGFSSALPYLLQDEYSRLYEKCLMDSQLVRDRVLDGNVMAQLLEQHSHRHVDHGNRLWLLINAELWYRMRILGQTKDDLRSELQSAQPLARRAG